MRKSYDYKSTMITLEFNHPINITSNDLNYTITDKESQEYSSQKFNFERSFLNLELNFTKSVQNKTLYLKIIDYEKIRELKNSSNSFKIASTIEIENIYYEKIEKEEIEKIEERTKRTSQATEGLGYVATGFSLIALILSLDATGTLIKMAQIMKLVNKLRFINVEYGILLGTFLDNIGDIFNTGKVKCNENMSCFLKRDNGRFTQDEYPLCFSCYLLLKSGIYMFSFIILRIFENIGIEKSSVGKEIKGNISLFRIKIWRFFQKIHLLVFNIIVLDVIFFATRRITQSHPMKLFDNIDIFFSIFLLSLIIYDFSNISLTAFKKLEPYYVLKDTALYYKEKRDDYNKKITKIRPDDSSLNLQNKKKIEWVENFDLTLQACEINISNIQFIQSGLTKKLKMNNEEEKKCEDEDLRGLDTVRIVKISNIIFLGKMILYQILIAALIHSPTLLTSILIITEIVIVFYDTWLYFKRKHYKNIFIFLQRNLQILCILVYLWIICNLSLATDEEKKIPVPKSKQHTAIYLLIGALITEYLLLFFTLFSSLWDYCFNRDKMDIIIPNIIFTLNKPRDNKEHRNIVRNQDEGKIKKIENKMTKREEKMSEIEENPDFGKNEKEGDDWDFGDKGEFNGWLFSREGQERIGMFMKEKMRGEKFVFGKLDGIK